MIIRKLFIALLWIVVSCSAFGGAAMWTTTGSMSSDVSHHTATLLPNGKVLVVDSDSKLYDPATGLWTATTGAINIGSTYHTATLLKNGKVLVAGGNLAGIARAELYDPNTDTWTVTGSLNTGRGAHTAVLLSNGKVLVSGGVGSSATTFSSAELYDPATGTWTVVGSMSATRRYHTMTLLENGKVLVAGGLYGTYPATHLSSAELYNPVTNQWTPTGAMSYKRATSDAVLLPNGQVLVMGGQGPLPSPQYSAELYNPSTGKWTETSSMSYARTNWPKAVCLPNNQILVSGGSDSVNSVSLDSAELYNYLTGTWEITNTMNFKRSTHTATLLPNGKVLVAGGGSATAELYTSGTLSITITGGSTTVKSGENTPAYIATYYDANGNEITGLTFTWSTGEVGDTGTATINSSGIVTGEKAGKVTVKATSGTVNGTTTLTVTDHSGLSAIVINDGSSSVVSGSQTPAFTAKGYDAYGNEISGLSFTWSTGVVGDTGTAIINSSGIATGEKDGTVTIKATSGGIVGIATLNVTGVGELVSIAISGGSASVESGSSSPAFIASGYDTYGNVITGLTFTWFAGVAGDTGTATINSSGIVTGEKDGTVTVKVVSGSVNGTIIINVISGALATISVTGGATSVVSGSSTSAFTASGYDVYGNVIKGLSFTWTTGDVSDTGSATINSNGIAIGKKAGTVTIKATYGGVSVTKTLIVNVGAVASIIISGGSTSIVSGSQTSAYIATGYDVSGNLLSGLTFTWLTGAVGDTGTATINSSGIVTGGRAGIVTIKATSGGATGNTTLNVESAPGAVTSTALSAGTIAGIAVGSAAAVAMPGVIYYFYNKNKHREATPESSVEL